MKFVHIRRVSESGHLLPTGGMTIAYSLIKYDNNDDVDVVFNVSLCSESDLFCYETGRNVAAERMRLEGTLDVLPGNDHPRAQCLIDWISDNYFSNGFILIKEKENPTKGRYRWVSTFYVAA